MEGKEKTRFLRERRRHKRFKLSQALSYQWGMKKGTLRTVDVSMGGVRIQTDRPIPVHERVDLIILLAYEAIKPIGKVVWSDPSPNRKYDVGISFESISHQCLKRLDRFFHGITLKDELLKRGKTLGQSGPKDLKSKPFELDRLKANFLKWLHKSYPGDYGRYAALPKIDDNEIIDFLKKKGIDNVNIHYLLKSLRSG